MISPLPIKQFKDRNPTTYALLLVLAGALISAGIDYIKTWSQGQLPRQEIETLKSRMDELSNSVGKIQSDLKSLQDTVAKRK